MGLAAAAGMLGLLAIRAGRNLRELSRREPPAPRRNPEATAAGRPGTPVREGGGS